ncbi:MAG: L-arabinose ABC transporter permease AraH [Epulopiscium sp. Nele67-Bin004]|nr:MAG: L-arabinose ABC transporter permease AraH [Epulopiscium sp. Nele67-Bin004]
MEKVKNFIYKNDISMLLLSLSLFVIFSLFVNNFFSAINFKGLSLSMSTMGMVVPSMMLLLACKHIDLSVGSMLASAGVVAAFAIRVTDGNIIAGILAGTLYGVTWGAVYGYLTAYLGVSAFITTLGGMQIARGLGFLISGGKTIGVANSGFFVLGNGAVLGIPLPVIFCALSFLVFWFILNKTVFGRNILAIGGNIEAARLAGIDVKKDQLILFIINGLVIGFTGVVLASRLTSGQPQSFNGMELTVISACVLGGVSLNGGIAKISYILAGVFILSMLENVMNLMGINPFVQYVIRGLILIAAVLLDRAKSK